MCCKHASENTGRKQQRSELIVTCGCLGYDGACRFWELQLRNEEKEGSPSTSKNAQILHAACRLAITVATSLSGWAEREVPEERLKCKLSKSEENNIDRGGRRLLYDTCFKKMWCLLGGLDASLMRLNLKSLTVLNSMSEASLLWLTFQSWPACCIHFCFRVPLISVHRVDFCSKLKQVADSRASVCHCYL